MIDRQRFYDKLRGSELFRRGIVQAAVDGMKAILDEWEDGALSHDLAHLAYPLATTYHETDGTMSPIEEYGKGRGKPYHPAYGRGFVQLTWHTNYVKFGRMLGIPLASDYALALDPANAAKILLTGMTRGEFRKHKLADFDFTSDSGIADARSIINGDKNYSDRKTKLAGVANRGELVASYFKVFMDALANAEQVVVTEPDFSDHQKNHAIQPEEPAMQNDSEDLPDLPPEFYEWVAEKRKVKQAEAYRELNNKPLVSSSVWGFVATGFVSAVGAMVSQQFGIEIPSEAKDWLYTGIITVMGAGALRGRAKATTFITGFFK